MNKRLVNNVDQWPSQDIYFVITYSKNLPVESFSCDWTGTPGQPLSQENTWSCCSATNKCPANEGDCDSSDDCKDGLICGIDNCQSLNPGKPFPSGADCCVDAIGKLHFFSIPSLKNIRQY